MCGNRLASASIARFAWARSPFSSLANARLAIVEAIETRNGSTSKLPSCSASSSGVGSATDRLRLLHLLSVDLLDRRPVLEPRDLPLGGVPLRQLQVRRDPDLVRDRRHPLEELRDPLARRH